MKEKGKSGGKGGIIILLLIIIVIAAVLILLNGGLGFGGNGSGDDGAVSPLQKVTYMKTILSHLTS